MTRRYLLSAITVLFTLTSCGQPSAGDDATAGDGNDITDTTEALVVDDQTSPSSESGTLSPAQEVDGRASEGSSSSTTAPDSDGTTSNPATPTTTTNTTEKATTTAGGGSDGGRDTSSGDGSGDSDRSGGGAADEPDYDPGLKPLVDLARADLAGRLGVGTERITLVLAELRQWPNSAAGCPRDGLEYQQVPTDGSEIIFAVDAGRYRYVTGGTIYTPMLCDSRRGGE